MNTHMKTLGSWLLVVGGCLLCVLAIPMARFFYEFPAIPVFLTVTFWRDAVAFALIAVAGAALMGWGSARLIRRYGKNW
jgi:prepilin signal peptidase PulO-like enzyme (type II secretory pathway)